MVCIFYDDCIDIGHIDAGFNNRRADQNVRFMVNKSLDDIFKLSLAHFAVCIRNTGTRKGLFESGNFLLDVMRIVIQVEYLPLP